ncbi:MAG: efflux RND transporter periplasmic adaptor subunit [Peptostreptococcaceae bacterium]|jgi:RND family efflux transporter MFP subunit|nr:efflux RND transporter periplasmic adaptor subunit [Peptostreptococcaceae bacterium]
MKKKIILGIIPFLIIGILMACSGVNPNIEEETPAVKKPVSVLKLENEVTPVNIEYTGLVKSKEVKNISFKSTSKLEKLYVKEGDFVKKGQLLASLDKEDLKIQLDASSLKISQANHDVSKALENLNYAKDSYAKIQTLYDEGGLSKDELDKAKLNYDVANSSYNQSLETKNLASKDYQAKKNLYDDAKLLSDIDGYIVAINYKENELVQAGSPVLSIRSEGKIIKTSVVQKDLERINYDTNVFIKNNDEVIKAKITNINMMADSKTRTYPIEIQADNSENLYLESVIEILFTTGTQEGIWIPIDSIISSSIDYVYIVQDEKIVKKTINIESVKETNAKVTGLNEGDLLVIRGMKSIKDGTKVEIVD